jgi:hypothetical protein
MSLETTYPNFNTYDHSFMKGKASLLFVNMLEIFSKSSVRGWLAADLWMLVKAMFDQSTSDGIYPARALRVAHLHKGGTAVTR